MNTTRRCFLQFCGGATVGAVVSPLPWKLLDDVSIWTQNGTWVATTPSGPVSTLHTTCTLCPAGCGLRLRRVGKHTVSAWGVPGHPLSDGRLCPVGLGAAQVIFHPARIRGAVSRGRGKDEAWRLVSSDSAIREAGAKLAELRAKGAAERLAILDLRPGRSLSVLYGEFLASSGGGRYLTLPGGQEQAASALGDLLDTTGLVPGYDFSRAGAVISFGSPLFDGWSGAGKAPYVVQVETNGSMNSGLADSWLPIRPGTEAALALGLAHILGQGSADNQPGSGFRSAYGDLVAFHTPGKVAEVTGLSPRTLRATAQDLSRRGPVVAVGGGNPGGGPLGHAEELAIWVLNLTLGSVGRPGGVVLRRDTPELFAEPAPAAIESLWDVPDGSLDLLLVDGSLPGAVLPRGLLRRKMSGPTSLVVGMSPYAAGPTAEADLIIPTTGPGEWLDDVPPQALAARASYAFSPAVEKAPAWSLHPAEVLKELATAAGLPQGSGGGKARHEEVLRHRIDALLARGEGEVFDADEGRAKSLTEIAWSGRLEKILSAGGCWTGPLAGKTKLPALLPDPADQADLAKVAGGRLGVADADAKAFPLVVMLAGPAIATFGGVLPPVVNKLYRESNLKTGVGMARLNPATAGSRRWQEGQQAVLETVHGAMRVTLVLDEAVMPGVVLMAPGPDPVNLGDPADDRGDMLEICGAAHRPVWRVERAALREV